MDRRTGPFRVMIDALILRFDATLQSFGGVVIDQLGVTMPFPGRSLLAGMLGNALGLRHGEDEALNRLQERIRYAARCDRAGSEIVDYQTVGLDQPFLREGWTTRGAPESREGGTASSGTHIRYRHYIADAAYTVAITLNPQAEAPTLTAVETALVSPARPLFIGRKTCLPSRPIFDGFRSGPNLLAILEGTAPLSDRSDKPPWRAWWPIDEEDRPRSRPIAIYDDRDWTNQIHTGRRWMREGTLDG